jgi:hypothetical protein
VFLYYQTNVTISSVNNISFLTSLNISFICLSFLIFPSPTLHLVQIVRGGVQLGPLGTMATNRPTVLTSGDYNDGETGGMMIGRED